MKKKVSKIENLKIDAREVEEVNSILEALASRFSRGSKEYKAIELAAKALLFASQRQTAKEFHSHPTEG